MKTASRTICPSTFFWVAFVASCLASSGCQQKPAAPQVPQAADAPVVEVKPATDPVLDEALKQVRSDLSPAAGMPNEALAAIANSGQAPKISMLDDQPLSLALICMRLNGPNNCVLSDALCELRPLDDQSEIRAATMATTMVVSRESGFCSIIQPENIRDVQGKLTGESTLAGKVTFAVPDCFEATASYRAEKIGDRWRVSEFRFPYWGIEVTKNKEGVWKTAGSYFECPPYLVRVPFADAPRGLSPATTLWLGQADSTTGIPPGEIALQGLKQPLAMSAGAEAVSAAVNAQLRQRSASDESLHVRLNIGEGPVKWSHVETVLQAIHAVGYAEVRFGVSASNVVDRTLISKVFVQVAGELPLKLTNSTPNEFEVPVTCEKRPTGLHPRIGETSISLDKLGDFLSKLQLPADSTTAKEELVLALQIDGSDEFRAKDVLVFISACLGQESPDNGDKGVRLRTQLRWDPEKLSSISADK